MKKILSIISFTLLTFGLHAKENPGFYLDSLNLGAPVKVPFSHYSGFSDFQIGFETQMNFKFGEAERFKLLLSLDGVYNFNSTPRIDHLIDATANIGFGFQFNLGNGGWTLTPQLSGGMVFHILNGDFDMDGNVSTDLYFDQLYRFQLELAYIFGSEKNKKVHAGFYLSPSIEMFPGETYWGFIAGGSIGLRLKFDPTY